MDKSSPQQIAQNVSQRVSQRVSMTTLVVEDIAATRAFFENGLGWTLAGAPSPEIAFYQVIGGVFALYCRKGLAREIGRDVSCDTFGAVTIAWNARSETEVDAAYRCALDAGATPVKPPEKAFWGGYSSYVEIPGGHLLEIAFNPFWPLGDDGSVTLPPAP